MAILAEICATPYGHTRRTPAAAWYVQFFKREQEKEKQK